MTLITRARFELPIGFDARVLIGLCCEDIVWEDERSLRGSFGDPANPVQLSGTLGERHCYGHFSHDDGEAPQPMIEAVYRRLQWLCEHRLCPDRDHAISYKLAV